MIAAWTKAPIFVSDTCSLDTSLYGDGLSAPPSADSCGLQASKHACYNESVWEIGLLLLQDSNGETVSQQNCDNLTSPSDNSVGR